MMVGVFQRLLLPRFSGAIGEDSHEFLMTCREQLQSLGIMELTSLPSNFVGPSGSSGARIYRTSHLGRLKYLRMSFLRHFWLDTCRITLGTGSVTISRDWSNLHDYLRLLGEVPKLSHYAIMIFSTENERVCCFVHGLGFHLRIEIEPMASVGKSFQEVVDNSRTMDHIHCKAHGAGQEARLRSRSRSRDTYNRPHMHFQQGQSNRPIQETLPTSESS